MLKPDSAYIYRNRPDEFSRYRLQKGRQAESLGAEKQKTSLYIVTEYILRFRNRLTVVLETGLHQQIVLDYRNAYFHFHRFRLHFHRFRLFTGFGTFSATPGNFIKEYSLITKEMTVYERSNAIA